MLVINGIRLDLLSSRMGEATSHLDEKMVTDVV